MIGIASIAAAEQARPTQRAGIVALALLSSAAFAADAPVELETVRRAPEARSVPLAPTLRFQPQADISARELEQLEPYLKGKPLHEADREALGRAMRHLREVK